MKTTDFRSAGNLSQELPMVHHWALSSFSETLGHIILGNHYPIFIGSNGKPTFYSLAKNYIKEFMAKNLYMCSTM